MTKKIVTLGGIIVWGMAICIGFVLLFDYSTRPNQPAQAPRFLPRLAFGRQQKKLPTLFLFAHPQCPCTRATIAELARLLAHNRGLVQAQVLFYHPLEKPREWVESALWQQAKILPEVTVSTISPLELQRFGASTSGQTLLYDSDGHLVFSGGITIARGHEGDNTGRSAIGTYLQSGHLPTSQTPVFGCSITDTEE